MEHERKIIQIAVSSEGDNSNVCLFALCDDGTVAYMVITSERNPHCGVWHKVNSLPKDLP